jgi:hypothetical protein
MTACIEQAYGMVPKGHIAVSSRAYSEYADSELKKKCLDWLDNTQGLAIDNGELVGAAMTGLEDIDAYPQHANVLVLDEEILSHPDSHLLGYFISAVYKKSGEQRIIFDLDAPRIAGIGYGFDGILINTGIVSDNFGHSSSGLVINYGVAKRWLAPFAKGIVVNFGSAGNCFAALSSCLAINLGGLGEMAGSRSDGVVLVDGQYPHEFSLEKGIAAYFGARQDLIIGPKDRQKQYPGYEFRDAAAYVQEIISLAQEDVYRLPEEYSSSIVLKTLREKLGLRT